VRIDEGQSYHRQHVGSNHDQGQVPLHFQPQNRKTATMWAVASAANAIVIGK
jgi:hypothetical protein